VVKEEKVVNGKLTLTENVRVIENILLDLSCRAFDKSVSEITEKDDTFDYNIVKCKLLKQYKKHLDFALDRYIDMECSDNDIF